MDHDHGNGEIENKIKNEENSGRKCLSIMGSSLTHALYINGMC